MMDFGSRIRTLDQALFDAIPSQTSKEDRQSFMVIQRQIRASGPYVYLEIGSHLGGTIQSHYADPTCRRIYSIDKRPLTQPDDRGSVFTYEGNSTYVMREKLSRAFPEISADKLTTFDADASELDPGVITEAPDVCFIDGEHTHAAVVSDFLFCLQVSGQDALIALHDAGVVAEGIEDIHQQLSGRGVPFSGIKLGGSVYVFAVGPTAARWETVLARERQDEAAYFRSFSFYRKRLQREAGLQSSPILLRGYRLFTTVKDWMYVHVYCHMKGSPHA